MKAAIKLGFAPTRQAIFSAPAAVECRKLAAEPVIREKSCLSRSDHGGKIMSAVLS